MNKAAKASIDEKIHKLSELAEHNSNPHEANAAKNKAQELKELLERESKNLRGVFEKAPGEWWIRYTSADGAYHREKAGTKARAIKLYHLRKGEALQGKLPELRKRAVLFAELADTAITYVEKRYARAADDVARIKVIKEWFAGRGAENITSAEIRAALTQAADKNRWSASTTNHHHNAISLCYRLAIEAGKVKDSPIHRRVRKQPENNSRVRFLSADEEKKLRDALRSKPEWAEHEPELDLAIHTGLRRGSMYLHLVWENVDLQGRVAVIPRTNPTSAV